jgi:hypothetical protein
MGTKIHRDAPFAREARVTEFWRQVDASAGPDACWPWTGYAEKGYGRCQWAGRMVGAHELAVSFTTGAARPEGFDTCHSCDNPLCCNPAHLRFDHRQGNVDDMTSRGRQARGVRNGQSRLTEADVLAIRHGIAAGMTGKSFAEQLGVSPSLITEIARGRRWSHVGGPLRTQHGNTKESHHRE